MFRLDYDDSVLIARMSDLEKKQLPFATMLALNDAMFDVRNGWEEEIGDVYESPVSLTRKAVQYKKATKDNLVAEVFLRKEVTNGTPPSRYLEPTIKGITREAKPFEFLLREAGLIGADEFVVPARGFPLDQHGNIGRGVLNTLLADLQAARDPLARTTPESRGKRIRRKAAKARAEYFLSRGPEDIGGGKIQHLPRGIYQRTRFSSGSSLRMVLAIVKGAPKYSREFDAFGMAQRLFTASFPRRFKERLKFAVRTARIK